MGRFDCNLTRVPCYIRRQQALLDEQLDKRARLGRDLRKTRYAPPRRGSIWINSRKPGDETTAQKRESRLAISWNRRVAVGGRESALDRGLNRAFDAAKLLILRQLEITIAPVLKIKTFQSEGQER